MALEGLASVMSGAIALDTKNGLVRLTPVPSPLSEYPPERHDADPQNSPSEIQNTREAAFPQFFSSERFAPGSISDGSLGGRAVRGDPRITVMGNPSI